MQASNFKISGSVPTEGARATHAAGGPPPAAEVRRELESVLDSPEFRSSQRSQTLLRYLVEAALNCGVDRLKERTIGVDLFHREGSYDTGQDAIVRVAASDVRKRLAAHYQAAEPGSGGTAIRISLAPGSYVPEFETGERTAPGPSQEPASAPSEPTPQPLRNWRHWAVTAGLAAVCVFLAVQNVTLRSPVAKRDRLTVLPWSQLVSPGGTALLVPADSNFSNYKTLVHADQSLSVYTSQRWLDEFTARVPSIPALSVIPMTSVGDVLVAVRIASTLRTAGCSLAVRSGWVMQLDDFKSDRPVILLGSEHANPWVSLFNDRLNFQVVYDPVSEKQICRNMSPRSGESPVYVGTERTPMAGVGYATVALVRNLAQNGYVLIIAGTNLEGTEAASELATDLPRLTSVLHSRGIDPESKVEQLELLMRLDRMKSQSGKVQVIAHRVEARRPGE